MIRTRTRAVAVVATVACALVAAGCTKSDAGSDGSPKKTTTTKATGDGG